MAKTRKSKPKLDRLGWAPLPRSKAKNAYELLDEVAKVITEEPKRYDQTTFVGGPRRYGNRRDPEFHANKPACGTTGCFAGWISILKTGKMDDSERTARRLLPNLSRGWCDDPLDDLFAGHHPELGDHPDGSKAYARGGVRVLRKFQKKYEKELKARKYPRRKAAKR